MNPNELITDSFLTEPNTPTRNELCESNMDLGLRVLKAILPAWNVLLKDVVNEIYPKPKSCLSSIFNLGS